MYKFLYKLVLVCAPSILFIFFIEHSLSQLKTHYQLKKDFILEQRKDIQILTLGSSNAYYAINPNLFSCTGFNFAYNGQSPYYDLEIIKKYIGDLPNLKLVVLPAIFFTVGNKLSDPSNGNYWRIFFYKHYFNFNNEKTLLKNIEIFKQEFDSRNFSLISLHRDNVYLHIKNKFSGLIDVVPEKSGWFNSSGSPPPDLKKNIGPDGARAHSSNYSSEVANANLAYWQELIRLLHSRGISVAIIRSPEDSSYYKNLDQDKNAEFTFKIKSLAIANGVKYFDYSEDSRFDISDFIYYVDHLNPKGAKKFSNIINHDFIGSYCSR